MRNIYLILVIILSGCSGQRKTRILQLAHGLPVNHPVHIAMQYMADRVAEASHGSMMIRIYPGGQLGSEQQNVELLQLGSLAMTKVSAAVMEGFSEDYKVLGLPYLFKDKAHYFKVCDSDIGKQILTSTDDKWLRGLAFYDAGARSFYTANKPVHKPADLTGLKLRVMKSQTAMKMVAALGGSPTPLSWGELYTALQSGVVDGAENNPPTFYNSHQYEVCKYYTLDEHASIPDVLLMSKVVWDKLTGEQQSILNEAVKASVRKERELWANAEQDALNKLSEAGVKIIRPEKDAFAQKVQSLYRTYAGNPKLKKYIRAINNLALTN